MNEEIELIKAAKDFSKCEANLKCHIDRKQRILSPLEALGVEGAGIEPPKKKRL